MKRFAIVLLILSIALPASAREIGRYFESTRALGMGGAFTAVSDDVNALFYNPAGLAKIDKWSMGIINPVVGINKNATDFYNDYKDIDNNNTSEVTNLLRSYLGKPINADLAMFPYFATTNWAIGGLGRAKIGLTAHNAAYPELQVDADTSMGIHGGYGHAFGNFLVGAAVKYIDSETLYATYSPVDLTNKDLEKKVKDDMVSKTGFGADLGVMYKFDVNVGEQNLEPTIAVAAINLVEPVDTKTDYHKRQFNVGFSTKHKPGPVTSIGARDVIDVGKNLSTDDDYMKRLNMGIEAKLPMILSVRAGLNQGYSAFGATIDLWLLKLSYARYYKEIGVSAGDKPDLRQMVNLTLGW